MGHTSNVCAMAFGKDGRLLATGQEGRTGLIRVWDFKSGNCLAIVCGHQGGGLVCLDISPDSKAMAAVGADSQGRQTIALWDISRLGHPQGREHPHDMGRAPPLVLRQSTEYNVRSLRFSPYEDDRLMTCGKVTVAIFAPHSLPMAEVNIRHSYTCLSYGALIII